MWLCSENVVNLIAKISLHFTGKISSIAKRTQREYFEVSSLFRVNHSTNHKLEQILPSFINVVMIKHKSFQDSIIWYLYRRQIYVLIESESCNGRTTLLSIASTLQV